ncbi:MAG: hypothetical protein LC751_05185 [Actinobacteria bacterium]|nr:hypothetical protein [Actinomycetota bacterium]MCA1740062.1 hypothetical protein [Actinomycetota bacterium]
MSIAFASTGAAVVGVALLRVILHRTLTRVPENALKLGVSLLLSSFGTFWIVEGLEAAPIGEYRMCQQPIKWPPDRS